MVGIEPEVGYQPQPFLEEDAQLDPGERPADAFMRAVAKVLCPGSL